MNTVSEYRTLNRLARRNGIVLMGTGTISALRFNEMLGDYEIDFKVYNRSAADLTAASAAEFYRRSVEALAPATLIVSLGENEAADETVTEDAFASDLDGFICLLQAGRPGMHVILSEIPCQSEKAQRLNRVIRRISHAHGVEFAPLTGTEDSLNLRYFKSLKPYLFKKQFGFADAFAYAGI